jgi:hypothetical protein
MSYFTITSLSSQWECGDKKLNKYFLSTIFVLTACSKNSRKREQDERVDESPGYIRLLRLSLGFYF